MDSDEEGNGRIVALRGKGWWFVGHVLLGMFVGQMGGTCLALGDSSL